MAQQSQRDAIIESIIKLTDEEIQSLSHGKLKEYRKSFQSLPFPSMRMEWSPSTDGLRKEFISSRNMLVRRQRNQNAAFHAAAEDEKRTEYSNEGLLTMTEEQIKGLAGTEVGRWKRGLGINNFLPMTSYCLLERRVK
eukprot:251635_1